MREALRRYYKTEAAMRKQEQFAYVTGYTEVIAPQSVQCDECDATIAAGQAAYLQRWSDDRPGAYECAGCMD